MIRRALPIRFSRLAETGRTKPLRAVVETDDGSEHEVVMKISSGIELGVEGLMNEMLGATLAADLGLPVPEPFFVEISPEFCQSMPSGELRASPAILFAAGICQSRHRQAMARLERLRRDL
ncbi:HipA family kinase [Bradyrhizobium guangxiense]